MKRSRKMDGFVELGGDEKNRRWSKERGWFSLEGLSKEELIEEVNRLCELVEGLEERLDMSLEKLEEGE